MRVTASVILGALVVLSGCAGAARETSSSVEPTRAASPTSMPPAVLPTGWTEFESPRYGYVIGVPEGWRIEAVAGTGGLHPGEPGTDTFSGDNRQLSVTAIPIPPGTDPSDWRSPITEHYEGPEPDGHGLVAEIDEPVTIDGTEGSLRRYRLEIPPYEQLILDAKVIVDGQAYLITYLGFDGLDEEYESEFSSILETFEVR